MEKGVASSKDDAYEDNFQTNSEYFIKRNTGKSSLG